MDKFIFKDPEGRVFSVTVGELEGGNGLPSVLPISARLITSETPEEKVFTFEEILDDAGLGEKK